MSTDDLRILLALGRTGKLVAAATMLGVDQTTVRRRLKRLEATFGASLIGHAPTRRSSYGPSSQRFGHISELHGLLGDGLVWVGVGTSDPMPTDDEDLREELEFARDGDRRSRFTTTTTATDTVAVVVTDSERRLRALGTSCLTPTRRRDNVRK